MLILSRKVRESIVIDGTIIVRIIQIDRDTVRLGIQAPSAVSVHRQEIHEAIQRSAPAIASLYLKPEVAGSPVCSTK